MAYSVPDVDTTGISQATTQNTLYNPLLSSGFGTYRSYKYTYRISSQVNPISLKVTVSNIANEASAEVKLNEMIINGALASLGTNDPDLIIRELLKVEA